MKSHRPNPARTWPRLWPYVVCVLLGLAAAQPILVTWRLPQGHDALFHMYRTVQLDALLRQGILYARWAPDMARGFGYPLYNYYAPLSYYVVEAFHLLGLPIVPALLAAFVSTLVVAALTMFAWARDHLGERAGILAAATYVLSPYLVEDLVTRSVLAELFALALLPLVLFSAHRLLTTHRLRYVILMSVSLAAVILCHNVTALVFVPFLSGYILWTAAVAWRKAGGSIAKAGGVRKSLVASTVQAFLAMLAAVGMAAFFWLPALAESKLVQMDRLTIWSLFDYHLNFEHLWRIFSLPIIEDLHLINRPIPYSLSLIAALLALAGIVGLWRHKAARALAAPIGFAALAACVAIFMVLPISDPVWAALPQMRILQFPWRFLGFGALFLAFLAGAALKVFEGNTKRWRRLATLALPIAVGALYVWVFTWQAVPKFHGRMGNMTIADMVDFERRVANVGTTTTGEYLPVTAKEYPPPEQDTTTYTRERLDTASLPEGTQVLSAVWQPLEYRLTLDAPRDFVAVFNTLDYAGWQAWVDGVAQPITPTDPYGLISVPVPAGKHELRVRFGTTPVRTLADAISLLSLAALVGGVALSCLQRRVRRLSLGQSTVGQPSLAGVGTEFPLQPDSVPDKPLGLSAGLALGIAGVLALGFAVKTFYIDPQWAAYRRMHFAINSNANFDNHLILVGADQLKPVQSGAQTTVVLYWRVPATTTVEYSISLHLVDAQGRQVAQCDNQHPGGFPTTTWGIIEYARDPHTFIVPAGTPPGRYTLRVATYPYGKPGETLSVLDANAAPAGRSFDLAMLDVTRPSSQPRESKLTMTERLAQPVGDSLTLLGYDLPQREIRTGEKLPLALYWKAARTLEANLTAQMQMADATGTVVYRQDVPPVPGYDTAQWRAGDIWQGTQNVIIPPRLSGMYTLSVAWPNQTSVQLGTVNVLAPPHVLAQPPTAYAQQATFGELASLVGYDVPPKAQPGQTVTPTLVWRVSQETTSQYKIFVHLLGPDGRLIVGDDAVPGAWQRPSTSWIEGEYITDPHALSLPRDLPAGLYRLEVGLYDSASGKRLPLSDGKDALLLSQALEIQP
jgi:hypothetical protein